MTRDRAIRTLRFQLSKSDKAVGPGLKDAIRLAIVDIEKVRDQRKGDQK